MNYRYDRYGRALSVLGFGCMRFPKKLALTDMEETEREIMAAYKGGVNYFDTAYIYPGSEAALGEIFEKNGIRDEVYIATKLPHYLIKSIDGLEKMFREQLKRLRTDRIDYYLMHMLTDTETWQRLCDLGIREWLLEKKSKGEIGQVGFSYHGNSSEFCRLIDAYDWDMCLIQYNYMDEHTQAGRKGLKYAASKGIPVMIMEPLRGGKLVSRLPEEALRIFAGNKERRSPAEWAFRWLWDQPEVTVVLSGMNSMQMLNENMKTASLSLPGCMSDSEKQMLKRVASAINSKMKIPCTGCGYCTPCPKGVDIPGIFAAYNRRFAEGRFWSFVDYVTCTALRKNSTSASKCVSCGKCERHCPQKIAISRELKRVQKAFEGPIYKTARTVASKIVKF